MSDVAQPDRETEHDRDVAYTLERPSLTIPTVVGLVVIVFTLWLAAELVGLALGALVALSALVLPAPFVVGVAFVALAAGTGETTLIELAGVGVGTAILLLSSVWDFGQASFARVVGVGVLAVAALAGAYYLGVSVTGTIGWGVITTGVAFAVAGYGLYRYGIVQQQREAQR